jgi:hypothetical protein
MIADGTGLSKSAVQAAVLAPSFTLVCHWRSR